MKKTLKIGLGLVGCFLVGSAATGLYFRKDAGGIWHVPSYLYTRYITKTDLFSPQNMFLKHGNRDLKEIAVTIDDGPHPASLTKILDELKDLKAQGYSAGITFFPVGVRMKQHPELVRRMVEEGYEVGNHTQDHLRLTKLRPDQIQKELDNWDTNFYKATGRHAKLMRPPGESYDDNTLAVIKPLGYITVGWTGGAKDFVSDVKKTPVSPLVVGDRITAQADAGGILILHDAEDTAEALPHIIRALNKQGYKLVTINEMLAHLPKPVIIPSDAGPLTEKEQQVVAEFAVKAANLNISAAGSTPAPKKAPVR